MDPRLAWSPFQNKRNIKNIVCFMNPNVLMFTTNELGIKKAFLFDT